MRLRLELRHLLLASWPADPEAVSRRLPVGLEPAEVDGESIVTVVTFRCTGGRLGRLPLAPFSQLNARTYLDLEEEPAVFFLRSYTTTLGLGGALFGAPYRPARIRVSEGAVGAPGLGFRLRYRLEETPGAEPGLLGRHELGIFAAAGLRAIRVRRGPAEWHRAVAVEPPRADLLQALGFDPSPEPALLYAPAASFETEVPPRKLRAARRAG